MPHDPRATTYDLCSYAYLVSDPGAVVRLRERRVRGRRVRNRESAPDAARRAGGCRKQARPDGAPDHEAPRQLSLCNAARRDADVAGSRMGRRTGIRVADRALAG